MTPPIEAAIMKHVGAPAFAAAVAVIAVGGSCLIGIVFLAYGAQFELSRWMSQGAAAVIVGIVLFISSFLLVARKVLATKDRVPQEQVQTNSQSAGSLLSSNLNEFARTAVIGISARRPIAMLAIAALAGAALLVLSDGEKDARTANGRKPF